MALFKRPPVEEPQTRPRRSIVAAAVDLSQTPQGWKARNGEDSWQKEAWNQYDICGELRYATNWIANAVSMATMYAADLDEDSGQISGATDNNQVQQIAATILGGAVKRSQYQSTIALNWQVAGEVFILVRPSRAGMADEWIVLSSTEIEERGGSFKYCDPTTGAQVELTGKDMLIRVWSPHPRYQSHADSAVRAALPILKEVERTSQNIAARLDSRLVGSGVWIIPKELDFAQGDEDPQGPEGLMDLLRRAAEASLSNPGQASSQVPIILEAPGEQIANFSHQSFTTELSAEVLELRTAAIRRLALTLDMPAELILGMGESNHWSAWQIEEAAYKIHVAPLLDRIADGITTAYFHPALRAAGIEAPERYVLAFDVSDIISRPNQFEQLNSLFDKALISEDYLLNELGIPDEAKPTAEDEQKRLALSLITAAPSLIQTVPALLTLAGIEADVTAEDTGAPEAQTQEIAPPAEDNALPVRASDSAPSEGLVAAAELVVFDTLSRAGGRLLTREYRGQFSSVPKHELHTVIKSVDTEAAMEGSFQFVSAMAPSFDVDAAKLESNLRAYCRNKMITQSPHDREELRRWLTL